MAEAAGWLERGVQPDGRYTYGYDRNADLVSSDYNITRHAGVMFGSLPARGRDRETRGARGSRARPDVPPRESPSPRRLDRVRGAGPGRPPWCQRAGRGRARPAPAGDRRRRARTTAPHELARFLSPAAGRRQRPRTAGAGRRSGRSPASTSKFGTGQTLWTFALMDKLFPERGVGRAGTPPGALPGDAARRRRGLPAHVPGPLGRLRLAELGPAGLGEPEIAYARSLAGIFGLNSRLESQSGESGINGGSCAASRRRAPASGTRDRGTGAALATQPRRPAPRRPDRRSGDAPALHRRPRGRPPGRRASRPRTFPRPLLARGAWFTEGGYTQMDHQRHPLSGLLATLPLLEAEPAR